MTVSFQSASAIVSSASAATLTATAPASNPDDQWWALIAVKNNATINTPAGWSKATQNNPSASFTVALYTAYSRGAPSMVFTWTGAAACAVIVIRYAGSSNLSLINGHNSPVTGTTNPHTSATFNSTAINSLVAAFDVQSSATAQATTPAGWTGDVSVGDATSAISFAEWSKTLGASGSASGAISVTEGAVAWFQMQFELQEDPLPGQICI